MSFDKDRPARTQILPVLGEHIQGLLVYGKWWAGFWCPPHPHPLSQTTMLWWEEHFDEQCGMVLITSQPLRDNV